MTPAATHSLRATVVIAAVALSAALTAAPATADADAAMEARAIAQLQAAREAAGLPPLRVVDDLVAVARRHSRRMADQGRLFHSPDLAEQLSDWRVLGENVGRSTSPERVHDLWMRSPGHRDNILSARYQEVGIGVERRGPLLWFTQVFRQRASSTPVAAAAAPAPPPAPSAPPTPSAAPPPSDPVPPAEDLLARALATSLALEGGPPPGRSLYG